MTVRRLAESAQLLYAQLLDLALGAAPSVTGVQFVKTPAGGQQFYWYLQYQIGGSVKRHYLGPDVNATRERVTRLKQAAAGRKADSGLRRRLVSSARAAGLAAPSATEGRVLEALEQAGVFLGGGVLVGSHAFNAIGNMLGVRWEAAWMRTADIDVGLTVQVSVPAIVDFERVLADADDRFLPVPSLDPRNPVTQYKIRGRELSVGLLTPMQGRTSSKPVRIPWINACAEPVRFLEYLMSDTQVAVVPVREGVLVNLPDPARFALQKLVVSRRRPAAQATRADKDLRQAASVLETLLEDRPGDVEKAIEAVADMPPKFLTQLREAARRLQGPLSDHLLGTLKGSVTSEQKRPRPR